MTEKIQDHTLQLLREIRNEIRELKGETREGFSITNTRLAAIDEHMSGFLLTQTAQNDSIATLRERIERIERRLELTD